MLTCLQAVWQASRHVGKPASLPVSQPARRLASLLAGQGLVVEFSKFRRMFCGMAAADLRDVPQFLRRRLQAWSAPSVATGPNARLP
jgi:hypothetical protein